MNRNSILSFIIVATGTGALLATTATSQFGAPKAFVSLQPTTPGTSQSGHANVSGTSRAGQFVGGGAGLTNVNAAQLGGLAASAFGQLSSTNLWTGTNNFSNAGNSFTGNGSGLTGVNADFLDGINSTAFLQGIPIPLVLSGTNSNAIIHATNTTSGASLAAAIRGTAFDSTAEAYGGFFESNSIGVRAVGSSQGIVGISSGGFGVVGVGQFRGGSFHASDVNGYGVYATGTSTAIYAHGLSGIGINAYGTTFGGRFSSTADAGTGVSGYAGGSGLTHGVFGHSISSDGYGVYGQNTGSGGSTGGVYGMSNSTSGHGVTGVANAGSGPAMGVYGESNSTDGRGVFGIANPVNGLGSGGLFVTLSSTGGSAVEGRALALTGPTIAVYGFNMSSSGHGVYGSAGSTGVNYGVTGRSLSAQGYAGYFTGIGPDALYVENTSTGRGILVNTISDTAIWANTTNGFAGLDARNGNTSGLGVFGYASGSSGVNYGVAGQTASAIGYGIFAFGNSGATGTKSFRIDHPFDPENKYLLHYASESPMPQNFYVGNVITDAKGYAWVDLPDYFSEINTNFKYQLTVVDGPNSGEDDFVQVKVRQEIKEGRFQIRTSTANTKVSWRVDADRNDVYVRNFKPKDVVEKQGRERGTYQHPELYGMPKERGTNYLAQTLEQTKLPMPKR